MVRVHAGLQIFIMSKIIGPTTLKTISSILLRKADEVTYFGDLSDLGNELGLVIGEIYPELDENEISEFIIGFQHGVSLTNRTH